MIPSPKLPQFSSKTHNSIIPPFLYSIFSICIFGVQSSIKLIINTTVSLTNVCTIYIYAVYYLGRDDLKLQNERYNYCIKYERFIKKKKVINNFWKSNLLPPLRNEINKIYWKKVQKVINHLRGDIWNETAVVGQDR